jgi:hypothetical protein
MIHPNPLGKHDADAHQEDVTPEPNVGPVSWFTTARRVEAPVDVERGEVAEAGSGLASPDPMTDCGA